MQNKLNLLILLELCAVFSGPAALLPGARLITIKRPVTIKMPGLIKTVPASAVVETITSLQLKSPNEQATQHELANVADPASTTDDSNTGDLQLQIRRPDEHLNNTPVSFFTYLDLLQ